VVVVSIAEPSPASARPADPARLNQPWRGLIAVGELVVAAVLVVIAVACWHRGVTTMVTPLGAGQPPLYSTIFYGSWMAAAIGLVTVAAFGVLDAIRQILLALRTRRRAEPPLVTVAEPEIAPESD
jgi:hypothetical protein